MSGYSIAGALGGYGYDQYSAPSAWDEETNYNRVQRTERPRSFRARVDAKKREMRMAQQTALAENRAENPDQKKSEKNEDPCQCAECAPHLYRSHTSDVSKNSKTSKQECGCQGSCQGGLFKHMTQQDCFIIFVIIIIGIVLYGMYCTMCRLNDIVSRLGYGSTLPVLPNPALKPLP